MKQPVLVKPVARGWKVITRGNKKAHRIVATQGEAIQIGRRIAMNRACELIVYRQDSTIRSKDSFPAKPLW